MWEVEFLVNSNKYSRVNKFEKRRKNTKLLSIMLVIGALLVIVLIGTFIFGGNDEAEEPNDKTNQTNEEQADKPGDSSADDESNTEEQNQSDDEESAADDSNENDSDNQNVETEQVETDDENVVKAYTGNWQPIGTEQQGPHTTNYNEGTQDRAEMEEAARVATGLEEGNMTTWWLERGGEQQVIATVSDNDETKTYRVYLTWVDNEGWQPTKVEELKENDQKHRFQ